MTSTAQALDLVRRYATLGETRDLETLGQIFTEDYTSHSALGIQTGLGALRAFLREVWAWMPDIEVSIDRAFANQGTDGEPWVGACVTLRGTTAQDGQRIAMQEVWIFRFRDNRISERWSVHDEGASGPA